MPENKKKGRRWLAISGTGGVVIVFLCLCIIVLGVISTSGDDTDNPNASTSPPQAAEQESPADETPRSTEEPTQEPSPEPTAAPPSTTEALRQAFAREILGEMRSVEFSESDGFLTVEWDIADNLTEGMIRNGARLDVQDMIAVLQSSDFEYAEVDFSGWFPLANEFGEVNSRQVVLVVYDRTTVDRLVLENILTEDTYNTASSVYIHPAFQD